MHQLRCSIQFISKRSALILIAGSLSVVSPAAAQLTGAWQTPIKLGPNVNGPAENHSPFVTANGQRLYLSASIGIDNEDLYVCAWDSLTAGWGPRQILGPQINTSERELSPCQTPDGQYLWFIRYNGGQSYDLYYSIWDTAAGDWGPPQSAGSQFNSSCIEWSVSITPDGRRMYLDRGTRPNLIPCDTYVLWVTYWNDTTQWWDTLIYMGDYLNRTVRSASMGFDTTRLFFSSGSPFPGVPKFGSNEDLYVVQNTPPTWDSIENIGMPVSTFERETDVAVSADGRFLYFTSTRDTSRTRPDIYVAEWLPTSVQDRSRRPESFSVSQPIPNPFNASTSFLITLTEPAAVRVDVHNVLGKLVTNLLAKQLSPGTHRVGWGNITTGSGIYFIRVSTTKYTQTRKVLLLK